MRVHSAEIRNFRSIKHQKIEFSPNVNVLIGKNNAGKTNIAKAILVFFKSVDTTRTEGPSTEWLMTQDDWHNLHTSVPIKMRFQLRIDRSDLSPMTRLFQETLKATNKITTKGIKEIAANVKKALKELEAKGEELPTMTVSKEYHLKSDSKAACQTSLISFGELNLFSPEIAGLKAHTFSHTTPSGHRKYQPVENPFAAFADEFVVYLSQQFLFSSPTRERLTKKPRDSRGDDIANRLCNLHNRRRASPRYRDMKSEVERLPFTDGEFRPSLSEGREMEFAELMIDVADDLSLPIDYFGEGLQSSLSVVDNVIFSECSVVAIEEPENSLHPSGQRSVFELLKRLSKKYRKQIVITSHSGVFIDRSKDAKLFRVSCVNRETVVDSVNEPSDIVKILDDLGFKPSYALLSNGVIWVEGPSDRIYVRRWLELMDVDTEELGISILPYGGANLKHISVEDFMTLNRNFVVMMDSEKKSSGDRPKGHKRKTELKKKIEETGNYAWITKRRAIDNYVPSRVIMDKYGLRKFSIGAYQKLSEQVTKAAATERIFCSYRKVRDSIELAQGMTLEDLKKNDELWTEMKKVESEVRGWME
ncbi:MAG: AAA family ATPase [Thermoplasmata archaeon]